MTVSRLQPLSNTMRGWLTRGQLVFAHALSYRFCHVVISRATGPIKEGDAENEEERERKESREAPAPG